MPPTSVVSFSAPRLMTALWAWAAAWRTRSGSGAATRMVCAGAGADVDLPHAAQNAAPSASAAPQDVQLLMDPPHKRTAASDQDRRRGHQRFSLRPGLPWERMVVQWLRV